MYRKLICITISAAIAIALTGVLKAQNCVPVVSKSVFYGKSKPIREMDIVLPGLHPEKNEGIRNLSPGNADTYYRKQGSPELKPAIQRYQGSLKTRGPALNFEGIGNVNGAIGVPADPNGDVSESHYMQSINCSFAVWDKNGNLLYGPVDYSSLWSSLPGPWHGNNYNWIDPVFKYDNLADRWIISSMALRNNPGTNFEMVAVSVTNDPLGTYHCYAFSFDDVNDYPKLSVWPNGYYLVYGIYSTDGVYLHSLVTAVDREAMLAGEPEVTVIEFSMNIQDERFNPLPADFHGSNINDSLPCYIASMDAHVPDDPWDLSLDVYAFYPDWDNPGNSTFEPLSQLALGEFEPINFIGVGAPQPINQVNVSTLTHLMMYPLTYRQFENHESMVCCLTSWDGEIHYVKWYELRKDNASWYIHQQGNYAPDNSHRYMPSISINGKGDMALGYTVSDEQTFPSARMTGRRASDPPGVMTYQETELFTGLNFINTYDPFFNQNRWGDYASMMVDPADDTTFWFTTMYPKNGSHVGNWGTRIVAINLSEEFLETIADAGKDTAIFQNDTMFITQGNALNYSAIEWTTTGDGIFLTDNTLNSIYNRGDQDIINGEVRLIIHVSGYEAGNTVADTMKLTFKPGAGILELNKNDFGLSVSPNPSCGIVCIQANTGNRGPVHLRVLDSQGRLIFTEMTENRSGQFNRKLDFSYKESGIYYIHLLADGKSATGKIVVMR